MLCKLACISMPPFVSIIVPCYNEEASIRHLLGALLEQTYPRENMEVVISDGMSSDRTRAVISDFGRENPDLSLRVVDNPARTIPSALNRAIRQARGEMIVRLDAHSMPYPDYVEKCVKALESGNGDNVGGVWEIRPGARTWMAQSIAAAAAHPLGVGDAMYRLRPRAGAVDTVPFGSFRKALIEEIGWFDESLLTNEDYEFNARVRGAGGTIWLDPSIRSVYFSRATLGQLAGQYWRYGFWKWRMLRRYPHTLRWRQGLPPLFVISLGGLALLSFWFQWARFALAAQLLIYFISLVAAAVFEAYGRKKPFIVFGLPPAILTMHLAWGCGFIWSLILGVVKLKNG